MGQVPPGWVMVNAGLNKAIITLTVSVTVGFCLFY